MVKSSKLQSKQSIVDRSSQKIYQSKTSSAPSKSFFSSVGRLFIVILFVILVFKIIKEDIGKTYYVAPAYQDEYISALTWLKNHTRSDDVILTEWTEGHQVVALADRRVIATAKVYPSEAKDIATRYQDIATFFYTTDENRARDILYKYGSSYIFLRKKFDFRSECKTTLPCRKAIGTIIEKMLDKKPLKYLDKIFESKNFLIYKSRP